jgi:hybrid cluster-associated redox disulfide protein
MADSRITKDTSIEELVQIAPDSVRYLMDEGIRCIRCGEPIWGTLESAAREKGFDDAAIERFVRDLNRMLGQT